MAASADIMQVSQPEQLQLQQQPQQQQQQQASPHVDVSGRRRWARGKRKYDWSYYTFQEFVEFVQTAGLADAAGAHAFALDLWRRSSDEKEELAQMQKYIAEVQKLPTVPLENISGAVLLESVGMSEGPLAGPPGGCLQAAALDGGVDCWGGVRPESIVSIEITKVAPSVQAYIRSRTGSCLCASGQHVRFAGSYEEVPDDATTVFELLPRDGLVPLFSIATKGGGPILGTFIPRRVPEELANQAVGAYVPEQQQEQLVAAAKAAMAGESSLCGRRRHKQDPTMQYYTFEEMALYVQRTFQTDAEATLQLAKPLWLFGCVAEFEDEHWSFVEEDVVM